jgi:hypothetical protein
LKIIFKGGSLNATALENGPILEAVFLIEPPLKMVTKLHAS